MCIRDRHGGVAKEDLGKVNMAALEAGIPNLEKHVENMLSFGLPVDVYKRQLLIPHTIFF